jgi:hypothetical protein
MRWMDDESRLAFEESMMLRRKYYRKKSWHNAIYVIWALHLALFLVPDSAWLNMGVSLPDDAYIPDIVLIMMGYVKFPVSVFIFFATAPLFFVASLTYFSLIVMSCDVAILRAAKKYSESRRGKYNMVFLVVFLISLPLIVWLYPDGIFHPSDGLYMRQLKPYENKLKFFFLFGGIITIAIPAVISIVCVDIRVRLTSFINKEK